MIEFSATSYPESNTERDLWILSQRPPRNTVDPHQPYAFLVEQERTTTGKAANVATIFLTNRECPWRCAMCDLWRNTLTQVLPAGAIPQQISYALNRLPASRQIKLYNSGSFFDPGAIPPADYAAIAELLESFERVIVECHPSLVGDRTLQFKALLSGRLEVAMGLETAHEESLAQLNKRMTLKQYQAAAHFLEANDIDHRSFVLIQPPFMKSKEALHWAERSVDYAFDCGAIAVSLIPTRANNGAMELLEASGSFTAPSLQLIEAAVDYGVGLRRGRVFVDLWDMDRIPFCTACRSARISRLAEMNLSQVVLQRISCSACGSAA